MSQRDMFRENGFVSVLKNTEPIVARLRSLKGWFATPREASAAFVKLLIRQQNEMQRTSLRQPDES